MGTVLSAVVFNHRSGMVEDQIVNNFAFTTAATPPSGSNLDEISDALFDFYNDISGAQSNSLATYLAPCVDRSDPPQIRHFDLAGHLDGTAHGSPIRVDAMASLDATGLSTGFPAEVAICMSFRSTYGADAEFTPTTRPRARDRGRIYLGPLISSVGNTDATTGRVKPAQSLIDDITIAGARLRDAAGGMIWSVWSRKGSSLKSVTTVWVDDAWDTQRRRGERATTKTFAS